MGLLVAVLTLIGAVNGRVLAVGRAVGVVAVALMVAAILVQVFFRYVLNNALPWPDEAARFMMLWMTGLMAPTAFRRGGFVAIDTLPAYLPRALAGALNLILLCVSLTVLIVAVQIGYKEVTGFGGRFATASLYVPTTLDFSEWYRVPRSWMMLSLLVGVALLIAVNIELLLRQIAALFGGAGRLPPIPHENVVSAE